VSIHWWEGGHTESVTPLRGGYLFIEELLGVDGLTMPLSVPEPAEESTPPLFPPTPDATAGMKNTLSLGELPG
jgi:hypothetical protein